MRTAHLNEQGYRVLWFWNEQVNTEMEDVLQAIYAALTDTRSRASEGALTKDPLWAPQRHPFSP